MANEPTLIPALVIVKEVRHGLFRVHWKLECKETAGSYYKNSVSFQLCESQSGRDYTMLCDMKRGFKRSSTSNSNFFKAIFKLRENSEPQQQNVAGHFLVHRNTSEAKSTKRPLYVWLSHATFDNNVHLNEFVTGTWGQKLMLPGLHPITSISLWIDFGVTTLGVKNVICGLGELFDNQDRCDVQFQFTDGQKIGAHVLILSIGSPIFAAMFQSGFKETHTRDVRISEMEFEVFRQLLVYLYTGSAPKLKEENITQSLFEAADKYDVKTLREECINVLMLRKQTINNAINMLIWSHLHSVSKLYESTLKFIAENGQQIFARPEWLYLIKNYPELCLTVTQYFAQLVFRLSTSRHSNSMQSTLPTPTLSHRFH